MTVRIAPSVLAADFVHLGASVAQVEAGGADQLHVDVMDGHFVPNLSLGTPIVAALKRASRLPLDVHLMIDNPDRYLEAFVKAGASMLTVHAEVLADPGRTLTAIRRLGAQAGLAINPATPLDAVTRAIDALDYLLVMSVNPGFGGQAFIPESLDKVTRARAMLDAAGSGAPIEVDGGVDFTNAGALVRAGAAILVAGATIFYGPDATAATERLRRSAEGGH